MDKDRIEGSVRNFAGKAEAGTGDVVGDARTQASGRAREAAGAAQDLYGGATDAATGYARDVYDRGGERLRDGSQVLAQKVQENPLGALMIAGAIGFALALFMTRPARRPVSRWRY
jgi:uncharacterized protein YjbJ (UPF0337 family)